MTQNCDFEKAAPVLSHPLLMRTFLVSESEAQGAKYSPHLIRVEGRKPSCTHRIKSAAARALQAHWQSCQEAMASGTCSISMVTEAVDQTHPVVLEEEL